MRFQVRLGEVYWPDQLEERRVAQQHVGCNLRQPDWQFQVLAQQVPGRRLHLLGVLQEFPKNRRCMQTKQRVCPKE